MRKTFLFDLLLFALALGLYSLTLSPDILPADAGEFQYVIATRGIAHPPGYPLYTMVGQLFLPMLPHNPAQAVNLFSAVTAALTVALVGRATRRASGSPLAGVVAALALMVSASFWVTATQASIRPLTGFFVALGADRLITYRRTHSPAALFGLALAMGLGVTHHPSLVFPALGFGLYLLPDVRRINWGIALGGVALGFLPWLYLPLAGPDAPLAPAGIATWPGFWDHVLARGFSGDLFAVNPLERGGVWLNIMRWQFNPLLLIGLALGPVLALRRDWHLSLSLLSGALLHSLVTMSYRAPQTVEYLIPAYVLLVMLLGIGLAGMPWARVRAAAAALLLIGVLGLGTRSVPALLALSRDQSSADYAATLLEQAPPEATILAPWHHATPLWAMQAITGTRPDVQVVYVFPAGAEPLAETWVRRIEDTPGPLIVTGFYPVQYAAAQHSFHAMDTPHFPAWRVDALPDTTSFTPLDIPFEGGLRLLGIDAPPTITPGQQIAVRALWEAPTPATGFLHLTYPDGVVITAQDRPLNGRSVTHHVVGIPPEMDSAEFGILAGAYTRSTAGEVVPLLVEGQPRVGVGAVQRAGDPRPRTGLPFDGMTLLDTQVSQQGATVTAALTFEAQRPLLTDRIIKVDLVGEGWRVQSDHVPAEGAIPTLKWLTGWRIHDQHTFTLPPETDLSGARLQLVIYDQFTNQVYPVLDPSLNQQGEAVTIYQWP